MEFHPQLLVMLPCRSLTRFALTNRERLVRVLQDFLVMGQEVGLLHGDPLQCLSGICRASTCPFAWLVHQEVLRFASRVP